MAYTERSVTSYAGTNTGDGSYFGRLECKDGEYITRIEGRSGSHVDQLGATCSDGQKLGPHGYSGGGSPYAINGPFKALDLVADGWVDGIFDFGAPQHNKRVKLACPDGKYIVGYEGRSGEYLAGRFRGICGVKADEYCVNNLETDLCRNTNVNILNKACALNMSTTCRNRKDELDESVIYEYCKSNQDDPFCSCYAEAPDYIPNEIRGLVKCWNKTCAEKGYIPKNLRGSCPNITVCKQSLGADGSNILSSNVFVQDCGTRLVTNPSTPSNPSNNTNTVTNTTTTKTVFTDNTKSPYVPDDPTTITDAEPNKIVDFIKKNIKPILFFVIILAIVLGYVFWPRKTPAENMGQPMQPMPIGQQEGYQQQYQPIGQQEGYQQQYQQQMPMGQPIGQQEGYQQQYQPMQQMPMGQPVGQQTI